MSIGSALSGGRFEPSSLVHPTTTSEPSNLQVTTNLSQQVFGSCPSAIKISSILIVAGQLRQTSQQRLASHVQIHVTSGNGICCESDEMTK